MRRVMLLALLALALPTAALASGITINFGVAPNPFTSGLASYVGATLQASTAFNFGGGPYVVTPGPTDQSGLGRGDTIRLSPTVVTYGSGTSGTIMLTKSWSDRLGHFRETFTKFTADRTSPNAITIDFSGTLSGPHGVHNEPIVMVLNANQAGGPGNLVNWSLTEKATGVTPIPEPGTLGLLGTGLISLAGFTRRKFKLWT